MIVFHFKIKRTANFCFTWNNYSDEDYQYLTISVIQHPNLQYLVVGKEVGENGTPHLQGFIQFKNRVKISTVQNLLRKKAHIEVMRGTSLEASDYCKKENDFFEYGELISRVSGQGKRNDIYDLVTKYQSYDQIILDPQNLSSMVHARNVVKDYYNALHKSQMDILGDYPKTVVWVYGPSGSGKSYLVRDICRKLGLSVWRNYILGDKWSTGYQGQDIAWFDDFRRGNVPYASLLNATDSYFAAFEQKMIGDQIPWTPKYIFFTCVANPTDCYTYTNQISGMQQTWDNIEQLDRRITVIIRVTSQRQYVIERGQEDDVARLVLPGNIVPSRSESHVSFFSD